MVDTIQTFLGSMFFATFIITSGLWLWIMVALADSKAPWYKDDNKIRAGENVKIGPIPCKDSNTLWEVSVEKDNSYSRTTYYEVWINLLNPLDNTLVLGYAKVGNQTDQWAKAHTQALNVATKIKTVGIHNDTAKAESLSEYLDYDHDYSVFAEEFCKIQREHMKHIK